MGGCRARQKLKQKDPERPKKCGTGGINLSNFRLYYQDTMVQAQKHKHRAMEQDTKLRDKPTHLWTPYL